MKAAPSISTQILLAVLITAASVLGLSSIIELNILEHRDTDSLKESGARSAERIANSLAYPLWNLNRIETERVVLDEMTSGDVARIQVFDEEGVVYVGNVRGRDGAIRYSNVSNPEPGAVPPNILFSFSHNVVFKDSRIGSVTVDVTDANLQAEIGKLRWGIAIKLFLVVAILSIVLFIALRVLVIRPVASLKSWVERVHSPAGVLEPPYFQLSREINSLADAFKRKNNELENEQSHLQQLNMQMLAEIADRKMAQEALQRNKELLRAVVEDQTEMIVRWKPDGTATFVNEAYCRAFGRTAEECIGRSFFPLIPETTRDALQEKLLTLTPDHPISTSIREGTGTSGICWREWTDRAIFDAHGMLIELQSTGRDITERKLSEEQLKTYSEQLRALSGRLQSAREEEGMRIAREIHDELGGALTGLKWDLEGINKILSGAENGNKAQSIQRKIPTMTGLIDSIILTVRRISSELRPGILDDLGLIAAIEWQAQQFHSRTGIQYNSNTTLEALDLNRDSATAVFRIFQEILTNILRHAQAANFYVRLSEHDGYVELEVRDDGRGITESEKGDAKSLGILGMQERALLVGGRVAIFGKKGAGTTVVVRVPLRD